MKRERAPAEIRRFPTPLPDVAVAWQSDHGHCVFHRGSVCHRIIDDRSLRELLLQLLVPFAVLIHTVCGTQFRELLLVAAAFGKLFSRLHIHGNIVHVSNFELRDALTALRTALLVSVKHVDPMATLTIMHVRHSKIPFFHTKTLLKL